MAGYKRKLRLVERIYEYLHARAGKEVTRNELIEEFVYSDPYAKGGHKKKKKVKGRDREKMQEREEKLYFFLSLLEAERLIEVHKKEFKIKKPFKLEGKISISNRGDGFVRLNSGHEVFVPAPKTESAIKGDIVNIFPTDIGKKFRLEGEVIDITRRGRELYRMKISSLEGKYILGQFLDLAGDHKEGIIPKKSILKDILDQMKIGDVVVVKMKDEQLHEHLIFDVSFIRFEDDTHLDKDLDRILMKYNYNPVYPDGLMKNLPEEVNESTVSDWQSRVDLRDLHAITIDGATAKDFDDAISLVEEEHTIRFYVHIADVSYYVKQGSPLDEEAYRRATSVYLANRVVPMLPPELSENLCSLVAETNRLAFTVEMVGTYEGEIHFAKFYKSIIKVNQRYTYDMAEEEIQKNEEGNWICKVNRLAMALKQKRQKSGRIDLNLSEVRPVIDEEGNVVEIKAQERLQSHMLIEELMLSANIKVAEKLRKNKVPSLFRIHEPMEDDKLETLNSFLRMYGIKHWIRGTDYSDLKKALEVVQGHPAEKLFNYFLLRSFMQAYYDGSDEGHWGLGFKDYCHFTSPIRRYPDLVCHRALDALLNEDTLPYTKEEITSMGYHCSEEERAAADAERDMVKLKACRYVETTGKTDFIGTITGIRPHSVFVELEELNVEGVIRHQHFTDEEELLLPNEFSFQSKKYTKTFYLGEKLSLVLESIDYEEIRIFVKPKK